MADFDLDSVQGVRDFAGENDCVPERVVVVDAENVAVASSFDMLLVTVNLVPDLLADRVMDFWIVAVRIVSDFTAVPDLVHDIVISWLGLLVSDRGNVTVCERVG